uniref:DNA repair protein RAD5 n=1 Tax=Blastobotrys adeninivorans TaxID=409370 RepID=A0A060T5S8_BLAAD
MGLGDKWMQDHSAELQAYNNHYSSTDKGYFSGKTEPDDAHTEPSPAQEASQAVQFRSNVEAVVGPVSDSILDRLLTESKGDVQLAVNLFFDWSQTALTSATDKPVTNGGEKRGTSPGPSTPGQSPVHKKAKTGTITSSEPIEPTIEQREPSNEKAQHSDPNGPIDQSVEHNEPVGPVEPVEPVDAIEAVEPEQEGPAIELPIKNPTQGSDVGRKLGLVKSWTQRFIGSFQAEIIATRSGKNLIEFGEKLIVKRIPPSHSSRSTNDDFVVRVMRERDHTEIARLSEPDARFVAVLVDAGLCQFTATGIFADDKVRLGDYMIIQVECFLLRSAFSIRIDNPIHDHSSSKVASFDNSIETSDDKHMRLRQLGLVNLFNKINFNDASSLTQQMETPDLMKATELMGNAPPPPSQDDSKDFNQDQLDALYKRAAMPDAHLPEADPPSSFNIELRPYQKKGLSWMIQKETSEQDLSQSDLQHEPMHPLWKSFSWPSQLDYVDTNGCTDDDFEHENVFYANLYSGELSLEFPRQKKSVLGGILADEMGLGKTISTLSLMHSSKYSPSEPPEPDFARHTTLIVAPMSLLSQWESEVYRASKPGTVRVLLYYGQSSGQNLTKLLCGNQPESQVPNVLITSYGTLLSEHTRMLSYLKKTTTKKEVSHWFDNKDLQFFGLYGVKFFRVVLDEGHSIRNRNSKTSKACYDLRADRRWVLTGTPIVNKLEDLYSIVKFLGVEPWNNFSFWKAFITAPFESKGYVQAMNVVQSVMEPIVLRRTKDMKQSDGSPLVQLPPKTISIQRIKFSEDEHDLYKFVFARARSSFNKRLESGSAMKSYTTILTQIMRLRQVCCHPLLVSQAALFRDQIDEIEAGTQLDGATTEEVAADLGGLVDLQDKDFQSLLSRFSESEEARDIQSYGAEVMKSVLDGAEQECPICTEDIPEDQQAVTECWHMSCLECLIQHIEFQRNKGETPRCHICRSTISMERIYRVVRQMKEDGSVTVMLKRYRGKGQSAKIQALLNQLRPLYHGKIEEKGPIRTVVFSQFTSFLDIIQRELVAEGFNVLRFDGSMNQRARADVLEEFKNSQTSQVLLLSLRAGGVGLNLVCANRAYLMDPWWSFAVEAQAIDRIHRMGQVSPVQVVRFIIEGSLEERMLKIQERKKFLASTLGLSEEEKKAQRLEDIRILFEDD